MSLPAITQLSNPILTPGPPVHSPSPTHPSDLAAAAVAIHPIVVRHDSLVAVTAALRRPIRFLNFMTNRPPLLQDGVMFSELVDSVVTNRELRRFLDVLCQGTSGAAASGIQADYMVRAFAEMYQPGESLVCFVGVGIIINTCMC
jgi:hypothetical protein